MRVLRVLFPTSILVVALLTVPAVAEGARRITSQVEELEMKKQIIRIWMTRRDQQSSSIQTENKWVVNQLKKFQQQYEDLEFSFEYKLETYTPAYIQALIALHTWFTGLDESSEWLTLISDYPDSKYILTAYDRLGQYFREKNEYENAIVHYRECIANRDRFPEVSEYIFIGSLGFVVKKKGQQERAIAECYERMKNYANALLFWEQYRELQKESSNEALEAEVKIEMLQDLFQKTKKQLNERMGKVRERES